MLLVGFVAVITVVSVGGALVVVWVGLPIVAVGLLLARLVAGTECAAQATFLDRRIPITYRTVPPNTSTLRVLFAPYNDPQSWIDVGFALVAWFVATITWSLTLIWWAAGIAGLTAPAWTVVTNHGDPHRYGLPYHLTGSDSWVLEAVFNVGIGLIAVLTLPVVVHALASLQATLFGTILGARGLQEQVTHLTTSRTAARDAEAASLRKLERDLHDGPQQRLVRLQMDLGRALHQVDADPAKARAAMESSLAQAQQTLEELRNLSRGIAPPILVDRGLVAALGELTTRSAVPAACTTNLPRDRRPDEIPARVQDAAYYVVSEALTNAAKHAGATRAPVEVHVGEGMLRVTVRDDGVGGATYGGGGSGLAGLRDRLAGLDGWLDVDSPAGGPTVVTAVLPCE